MPHLNFPLHPDGLIVQAELGPNALAAAALRQKGQTPPHLLVRALLDSGTDRTAAAPHVFQHLGLAPFLYGTAQTAGGSFKVNLYRVRLAIAGPSVGAGPLLELTDLLVSELTVPLPFDVLIGLDVLRDCLLVVDGPGQQFILGF